ncbi:Acyl-CoA dehydrogenase N terminal [Modestobacter sp. DSM 44400]|uniref:acyl-CoA dehydrogenase C-terminal domain-containing protein n=1 Tax=Modestobacter sp. DSM 44400 TaxID=1550230 RepID=UPI00089BDB8C|nr:acyl-CoA dehydrogenase C-terminal domain-containing protein [Modestobacter sp. DSM 44400]SDY45172.1 Acyl-CoA dehydrogenase N terminal [Modestobacter sp. DSM 44400]
MSHYTADLRDLEFNLFEFQSTKDRFGTGPFEQIDAETARGVLAEVRRLAEGPLAGTGRLKEERTLLATALSDVQAMLAVMFGHAMAAQEDSANLYKVAQNTSRPLLATGDLVTGWLLVRQSEVALTALAGEASEPDRHYYEGKLVATRFFCTQVLPRLTSDRSIVANTDNA